jgi:hypothetical protein
MAHLLPVRRWLLAFGLIAAAWAVTVAQTGGGVLWLGAIRLSSHDPSTPAAIALVCAVAALALRWVPAARTTFSAERTWWTHLIRRAVRVLRQPFAPAVAIAVIATALHVAYLVPAAPLWADEEMLALNIRDRSIANLPGTLWLGQSAPFGWLVVQRVILLTVGSGEASLRLVPFVFGLATIGAALWVGRRWMTPAGAALFVLLCAFGGWLPFFRFELKHYSADAFGALLLPAVAAWALEDDEGQARWRWVRWWGIAALVQWFSNGGLLVTPACAVVLFGVILRRHGAAAATRFGAWGLLWLASFGAHYELTLRHAHESRYLRSYWAAAVPPRSADTLAWVIDRLEPLAINPGGTSLPLLLWLCVIGSLAFTRRFTLAAVFVTVPLSALALAGLRLVPLHERLSLWVVPALYLSVALVFDAALTLVQNAWRARRRSRLALGLLVALPALAVAVDVVVQGHRRLVTTPRDRNHGLDDRAAAQWLMSRRQPGDAVMTTRLGWPALLWYGGIPFQSFVTGRFPDGMRMYEVTYVDDPADCTPRMRTLAGEHRRILVHVGFPDMPEGFYELLLGELTRFGRVVESRQFAHSSRTAVVELDGRVSGRPASPFPSAIGGTRPLEGCVGLGSPRVW